MLRYGCNGILGLGKRTPRTGTRGVLVRLYHERIVDHYNSPRNVESFDENDPTIASLSVATEWIKGRQEEEVLTNKNTEIVNNPSLTAEDVIRVALKDFKAKQVKAGISANAKENEAAHA
ncbi:iron-sulfur cluster assembly protein 1-like [Papaver somniferum]|uniref:iron-sulfur cluster assembly protein 1-like n=1 Tax=Papaver somniferum TaxID=3469 RepID=UPI000E6FB1F5|nr:iron-sulfur cluster assembly protein 1-like [Papaver somniferum]